MALLLNIDTSVEAASVCLAKDDKVLAFSKNARGEFAGEKRQDHTAWLHVAIKEMFDKTGSAIGSIDGISVTEGPGSYTGLRIGMATAKGICYALNKPLITLNTLLVMANAAKTSEAELLGPMIDARRMEVFAAIYTKDLRVVKDPMAITLNEKSFDEELTQNTICFFGNGSDKFQKIKNHPKAFFRKIDFDATTMVSLAQEKFNRKEFADLAYAEPLYLKEFYTPAR
ncbi:MAG TPA: tRNA (adenosine(37)-N6)-threonylcarbamoyltransferase complex dimerization subunit type 1 TsaB [Chitinophagaceae bacterium]|nr:tRNA (adenosine(37)-N6)-threonylcarbamoyltransferase complex dimerization subunit type 1 TsaB [Chitinophagaceae bacterium]